MKRIVSLLPPELSEMSKPAIVSAVLAVIREQLPPPPDAWACLCDTERDRIRLALVEGNLSDREISAVLGQLGLSR